MEDEDDILLNWDDDIEEGNEDDVLKELKNNYSELKIEVKV